MLATVPLIGGVTGGVAARACPGYWSGLPPCSAVVAALSGAGSVLPQLEWKPQIRFWALRGGRWDWSPRTGRRARAVPRVSALCCVTWHLLCHRTKYTVASTALGPVSTLGMPAAALGSPRHCFHRSTSADQPESGPGTTSVTHLGPAGATKAAQTLAQPSPQGTCPQSPWPLRPPRSSLGHTQCPLWCPTGTEFTQSVAEV